MTPAPAATTPIAPTATTENAPTWLDGDELHQPRSPYLEGNYRPTQHEVDAFDLEVIGELPDDLDGVFVRNGSNPRFAPRGRYHWFDGDGMLHAVRISDGRAEYRNRWVRTDHHVAEDATRTNPWTGILEPPNLAALDPRTTNPYKDTGNTDLTFHRGRLYATWWLSGSVWEIDPLTLETMGRRDFAPTPDRAHLDGIDGALGRSMSAHPKVDPVTGEMVFFGYAPVPPYLRIGVISPEGDVVHHAPIELPGRRLQHDVAITERHTILFDMNLRADGPGGTLRFHRDTPSRIGAVPRYGTNADVQWFETEPFFAYHTINAWEEVAADGATSIVLTGCRIDEPVAGDPHNRSSRPAPTLGELHLAPTFHEWRLHLDTGRTTERQLDDRLSEFPRMNDAFLGRPSRYAYNPLLANEDTLLFAGLARYDRARGDEATVHRYEPGWFGGEVVFAPSSSSTRTAEDDGWLLTFVAEEASGRSELQVLDARRVADGPVARVRIPHRVPTGYHTEWVPGADL